MNSPNRMWRKLPAIYAMDYTGSYRVLYHGSITDTTKRRSWFGYTKLSKRIQFTQSLRPTTWATINIIITDVHTYVLEIGDVTQCILSCSSKNTISYSPLWLKFNGKSSSFMTSLSTWSWHVDVIMATKFSAGQPIRERQSKEPLSDWLTRCLHVSGLKIQGESKRVRDFYRILIT